MIGTKSRPLLLLFVLGGFLLLIRLWEVQVVEHELWAVEAARLVHSGHEIPYRRGRIVDARGRVLARDKDSHQLVLVYRDFRRGHPLGQVAHARSLLEGRAVSLHEARTHLLDWARELVELSPAALEEWGEGGRLETPSLFLEAVPRAEARGRLRRSRDVGFYAKRLLGLSARERRMLEKVARRDEERRSFLALAAEVRREEPMDAWARSAARSARSLEQLARLATMLEWRPERGDLLHHEPLERMIHELETTRRWVEDATASKLFAEATGFAPGRVDPATLLDTVDLSWIARLLAWDEARVMEWAREARDGWRLGWRDGYALPRLVWRLVLDPARPAGPDEVLSELASIHAPAGAVRAALDGAVADWREVDRLAVFDRVDRLFEVRPPRELRGVGGRVLPFQEPDLRERFAPGALDWRLVDQVGGWPVARGEEVERLVERGRRREVEEILVPLVRELVEWWDVAYQAALFDLLRALQEEAGPGERTSDGRLLLAEGHRDRAAERAEFFLKDYGTRPSPLLRGEPPYEVVYLLTRYETDYPGFEAREASEREYRVPPGDPVPPAARLVGRVSAVGVRDLLGQRDEARRLRELKSMPERSTDEELELEQLIGEVLLHDEVKGVAGVEGFWNEELVGRNGYEERHGLEDVFGAGRSRRSLREAVDGRDVTLTLDTDLQRAARLSLQHPPAVTEDPKFDWEWYTEPVGAVVLITAEGDVLAAASEPSDASEIGAGASRERARRIERTLLRPTFQPPGSVFKPFVAAYALSEVGLDPQSVVLCGPVVGGSGYKDVRCHASYGHGEVALDDALMKSCNAYFAWLGETLSGEDLRSVAQRFGFDAPSGLRTAPPWDAGLRSRGGLLEHVGGFREAALSEFDRRLGGNGLGVVEATPMQLARATLALATGELRDLRLVRRIGDEELPLGETRSVGLRRESLERVRRAMIAVATDPAGTAHAALSRAELGFDVAVKTGSADLVSRTDEATGRSVVRKHTWVAGWAPAEDPVLVFVVFVHDTRATSSHGAVYLARQVLLQPAVLNHLGENGVDLSEVRAR